jgi:hypothetical protein
MGQLALFAASERMMYEREVDVPRLVGGFRLDQPGPAVPQAILDAAHCVTERVREPFNSVGLNLYRRPRGEETGPAASDLYR